MANPLRKTMVYLGLADEEYEGKFPEHETPMVLKEELGVAEAADEPRLLEER